MANDSYYPQLFKCKCGINKHYTWSSELYDKICDTCKKKMTPIFEAVNTTPTVIIASKHAKGRTPQEREKRRTDHFKKEVLPTLPKEDRAHFEKKFKMPKKKG